MKKKIVLGVIFIIVVSIITISLTSGSNQSVTASMNATQSFYVTFTSNDSNVQKENISATTKPDTLTTTPAKLNGTTLNGMTIDFTEPNQKAIYTLYSYNKGSLNAYLKSITSGKIICTPGEGTTASLVNNACSSVTLKVKVGEKTATSTRDIDGSIPNIQNHILKANTSEEIQILVEYAKSSPKVDGAFTVILPTISLTYYSIDE